MVRVLAVDGGQSAIRLRHSGDDRIVEVEGVSRLEGDTVASVARAVAQGWALLGSPPTDRVVLGLTTAPTDTPSRERLCHAIARDTGIPEVWLADDAVTTHAGALSASWGVSVTAGTGVACLVVPRRGAPRIIGGHGFLLGDEGGAFWIGSAGVRAALRAHDGRGDATALSGVVARRFGGLGDLGDRLHATTRPVHDIATFAPDVLMAAAAGDAVAAAIVAAAVDELTLLIRTGITAARGADDPDPVPVALGGRLLASDSLLRTRLDAALAALEHADPRSAAGSSLDGAQLLAHASDPGRYAPLVHVWHATPVATG